MFSNFNGTNNCYYVPDCDASNFQLMKVVDTDNQNFIYLVIAGNDNSLFELMYFALEAGRYAIAL